MRRNALISVVVFVLFALTGPVIRTAFHPTSSFLILIWPALFLTSGGNATTLKHDLIIAAAANCIVFAGVGLVIGAAAKRRSTVLVFYLLTCGLLILTADRSAGFNTRYSAFAELTIASCLYLVPFALVALALPRFRSRRPTANY